MSTSEVLGLIISIIAVIVAIYFGIKQTPKKEVTTITSTIPKDSLEIENMRGIIGNNTTGSITKNEYNSGTTYNISSKNQKSGFTGVINNNLEDQKKAT